MDRNHERAVGANEPHSSVDARNPILDALDRHAEERDRLFMWALFQEAKGELERKDAQGRPEHD
jgi:hypothetical protein